MSEGWGERKRDGKRINGRECHIQGALEAEDEGKLLCGGRFNNEKLKPTSN